MGFFGMGCFWVLTAALPQIHLRRTSLCVHRIIMTPSQHPDTSYHLDTKYIFRTTSKSEVWTPTIFLKYDDSEPRFSINTMNPERNTQCYDSLNPCYSMLLFS